MLTFVFVIFLVLTAKLVRRYFERRYDISDAVQRFNEATARNDRVARRLQNR